MVSNNNIIQTASGRTSLWVISLILVIGIFFSALIPPFQSPDEPAHVMRAYLLSRGAIILDAPEGNSSGGMIDTGLAAYGSAFEALPFKSERKLSIDEIESAKTIKWTGKKEFRSIAGTGFYFPLSYMPQAIGLATGEMLGLNIDTSYLLARFMSLATLALILFAAFKVYPVNPLAIAFLVIPMSVFQFASASLDGITTALAVFAIALFLRITVEKKNVNSRLFYALAVSVALVATSRAHLLPLLALVLVASFYIQKKKFYYVSAFAVVFVLGWTVIASKTTVGFGSIVGASTTSVALFYIKNPLALFEVLIATFSNADLVQFYRESFLGVLGWLDTRFSTKTYNFLFICTVLIGLLSVSIKNLKTEWVPRVALLFCAIASIFLIFFALLITWNKHPASLIQGVQGRYFLVPMIMIAYAISGELKLSEGIFRKFAILLLIFLGVFTIFSTPKLLVERYYLALEQPEQISLVMRASEPLDKNKPITLVMSKKHEDNLQPLKRIGIMFGTYIRKNPGMAELRLTALDGHVMAVPFNLPDLADNKYKYIELDSIPYSSGKILYLTGGGISTWEAHKEKDAEKEAEKGLVATCLIYEYTNGKKLYTRGCPRS